MKITRDDRQNAKKLFNVCMSDGRLDEAKLSQVVKAVAAQKPRGYLPILTRLMKLVDLQVASQTVSVESAVELSDKGEAIFREVESKVGPAAARTYRVVPELIGGVRIRRGSDVWDGSIRTRLNHLKLSN